MRRPAHLDRGDEAVLTDTDVAVSMESAHGALSPWSPPPTPSPASGGGSGWGPFDDQRIDHGEALSLRVDDNRVEVDLLDQIGVVSGKARQACHQLKQSRTVRGRRAAHPVEQCGTLQLPEERLRLLRADGS